MKAMGIPSTAEYVRAAAREGIGLKSALIQHAAAVRDMPTTRWSRTEILVEMPGAAAPIYFHRMNGPLSIGGRFYCDQKTVARDVLRRAELSTATSHAFDPRHFRDGIRWAEQVGYPVVAKPTNAAQGRGVTANIQSPERFAVAWRAARSAVQNPWLDVAATFARSLRMAAASDRRTLTAVRGALGDAGWVARNRKWRPVLLEKHFDGKDFRAFVVGDEVVSMTQRKAANVVGDGRTTVLELIGRKNAVRAENPYLGQHLIPTVAEHLDVLTAAGRSTSYVPAAGEVVVLRSASNLSAGGDSIDLTDEAHPGFAEIAIRAVHAVPGIEYAGVDLITPDITAAPTATNHVVSEIEFSPAPGVAHFPLVGAARDMAGAVLDHYLRTYADPGSGAR